MCIECGCLPSPVLFSCSFNRKYGQTDFSMKHDIFVRLAPFVSTWKLGKLYCLYVVVSHLLHYSTAVLTESAGVWANRFFHEAPISRGVFMKLAVCIMHCLYAVVPHPLCYLAAVLTEKLFPRGTHTKVCICKIGCLCGHLKKKKRAVTNCLLSFTNCGFHQNECLGRQISLKMTYLYTEWFVHGCFPFPATEKTILTKSAAASQDLKVWCVRPLFVVVSHLLQ